MGPNFGSNSIFLLSSSTSSYFQFWFQHPKYWNVLHFSFYTWTFIPRKKLLKFFLNHKLIQTCIFLNPNLHLVSPKDQNLFLIIVVWFQSKVSKIVATTLNDLLSPLKTPNSTLFQIPKKPYLKLPIIFILDPPKKIILNF